MASTYGVNVCGHVASCHVIRRVMRSNTEDGHEIWILRRSRPVLAAAVHLVGILPCMHVVQSRAHVAVQACVHMMAQVASDDAIRAAAHACGRASM